jgi:hypothetical protein
MDNNKKGMKDLIVNLVHKFSDKEYQKRVWLEGKGSECESYDEAFMFFCETYDDIREIYKNFGFSEEQNELLEAFYKKIDEYDENAPRDYAAILNDPKWNEICQFAKKVYEALKEKE